MGEKKQKKDKPRLKLSGEDGNAFSILSRAKLAANKAGWTKEKFDKFMKECQSGDYNHLLKTCMDNFDVY